MAHRAGIIYTLGIVLAATACSSEVSPSSSEADAETVTAAAKRTLTIEAVAWDNANAPQTGLYVTVMKGTKTVASGFTPLTAKLPTGTYTITAADFQSYRFAHWDDGTKSSSRTVKLTANTTYKAYYQVGGTIVPLYEWPVDDSGNLVADWLTVAATHVANPGTAVIVIANNQNGPGPSLDPNWQDAIDTVVQSGCRAAGYVWTNYGARDISAVENDIANWHSWYPNVTAIFLDGMNNVAGGESYYADVTSYAKSNGFDFVVGNPGTDTLPSYVGTVDTLLIYEGATEPSPTALQGWHTSYSPNNFGVTSYGIDPLPASSVAANEPFVAYQYVASGSGANPYSSLPAYFGDLVGALAP